MTKRNMDTYWDYTEETGPEHWHTLCEWFSKGATFPLQSPIALANDEAQVATKKSPLEFYYVNQEFSEKEFKNTMHFVPIEHESYVTFEGSTYYLTDIHFHLPSEHVINDRRTALEMHFVHTNERQENLVVGVLVSLTNDLTAVTNHAVTDLPLIHPYTRAFNPQVFLPKVRSHFHYVGSLTTPPTSGPIQWFVFDQVETIAESFITPYRKDILPNNFRPLQDRQARPISFYPQ